MHQTLIVMAPSRSMVNKFIAFTFKDETDLPSYLSDETFMFNGTKVVKIILSKSSADMKISLHKHSKVVYVTGLQETPSVMKSIPQAVIHHLQKHPEILKVIMINEKTDIQLILTNFEMNGIMLNKKQFHHYDLKRQVPKCQQPTKQAENKPVQKAQRIQKAQKENLAQPRLKSKSQKIKVVDVFDNYFVCTPQVLKFAVQESFTKKEIDNLWIIGFEYEGVGDIQLGMTGTAKQKELPLQALRREMIEETGLDYERVPYVREFLCERGMKAGVGVPQQWLVSVAMPSDLTLARVSSADMRKDSKYKVAVAICGEKKDLINMMTDSVKNWGSVGVSDGISAIVIAPLYFLFKTTTTKKILKELS